MYSTVSSRHFQRRILYWNVLIWSIGNMLTSSIVVIFMLEVMGFTSPIVIALAYATSYLGRIFQPLISILLKGISFRRKLCISLYWVQVLMLWLMLGADLLPIDKNTKFWMMLICWAFSNFFESMAYTVFLSWNRLLFSGKILGRFYSRRDLCRVLGECITVVCLAVLAITTYFHGKTEIPKIDCSFYEGFVFLGSLCILASSFMLWFLPDIRYEIPRGAGDLQYQEIRRLVRPFSEKKFRPFLYYGAFFSFFIQFEQVSQITFQKLILSGTPLFAFIGVQAVKLLPRIPQLFLARPVGNLVDRYGTLNVMICSQILTAIPLLLYAFTKQEMGWMLYIAAILWGSYVGLNVALPKFLLEISDSHDDAPWMAAYGSVGNLTGFVAVFLGGFVCNYFKSFPNYFTIFFLFAFCWRVALAFPLMMAKWEKKRMG